MVRFRLDNGKTIRITPPAYNAKLFFESINGLTVEELHNRKLLTSAYYDGLLKTVKKDSRVRLEYFGKK